MNPEENNRQVNRLVIQSIRRLVTRLTGIQNDIIEDYTPPTNRPHYGIYFHFGGPSVAAHGRLDFSSIVYSVNDIISVDISCGFAKLHHEIFNLANPMSVRNAKKLVRDFIKCVHVNCTECKRMLELEGYRVEYGVWTHHNEPGD